MFKKYDQKQQFLLPLNLEEFVSEDHISRVINELFDFVDIRAIGGNTSVAKTRRKVISIYLNPSSYLPPDTVNSLDR